MSVRDVLLALLSQEAKYGAQLRREYELTTGGLWPLNIGQVYTTLQHLKRDGLIESDASTNQGRAKRVRITESGDQEVARWWSMPPDWTSPPRDQLVMKILLALRLPNVTVDGVIQDHRRHLARLRDEWTRIKEEAEAECDLALGLAIDAELFRLDSVLRWLDSADHRVQQQQVSDPRVVNAGPGSIGETLIHGSPDPALTQGHQLDLLDVSTSSTSTSTA